MSFDYDYEYEPADVPVTDEEQAPALTEEEVQALKLEELKAKLEQLALPTLQDSPQPYSPVGVPEPSLEPIPSAELEPPQINDPVVGSRPLDQAPIPDFGIANVKPDIGINPETGRLAITVRPQGSLPEGVGAGAPQGTGVPLKIEPYEYLTSRSGKAINVAGANRVFAEKLTGALQEAEAATGSRAVIRDMQRDPARQAQYYANYTGRPVTWQGVTYTPQGRGGLAAPPGRSRHQGGNAADIQRGPVLSWMHANRDYLSRKYGLEFLKGQAFARDPVHIQLAGTMPRGYEALLGKRGVVAARPDTQPPPTRLAYAGEEMPIRQVRALQEEALGPVTTQDQINQGESNITLPEIEVTPEGAIPPEGPVPDQPQGPIPPEAPIPEAPASRESAADRVDQIVQDATIEDFKKRIADLEAGVEPEGLVKPATEGGELGPSPFTAEGIR